MHPCYHAAMKLAGMLLACALVLGATACSGSGESTGDRTATAAAVALTATREAGCTPARPAEPGDSTRTIAAGAERRYILHVPPGYDGVTRAPLILAFHGLSMPADLLASYTAIERRGDPAGYIIALPYGMGEPAQWNGRMSADGADDVGFIRQLLSDLRTTLCIDDGRIYAAGMSNGGGMAQRMACEMPEVFAAIGIVAGTYMACVAAVPLVALHGNADPIVPYDGAEIPPNLGTGVFPPVRRAVSEWAKALGCDGLPLISRAAEDVELATYPRCLAGDGEALLYTVLGGGHSWPGSTVDLPPHIVGSTTHSIDATAIILDFFAARSRG